MALWGSGRAIAALLVASVTAVCAGGCRSRQDGRPAASATEGARPAGVPVNARREAPPPGLKASALALGARAPAVALASSGGDTWSLQTTLAQGPVVVVFYRGHWCPYCRTQLVDLQQRLADFTARGATLVAIAVDPADQARALAARLGLSFPLLSDPTREVVRAFGVEDAENAIAWPAIFIIARDGTVTWRAPAETYKLRPLPEAILEALATE